MASQNYFSIYRDRRNMENYAATEPGADNAETTKGPKAIFQWLALFLGVIIQPFYAYYKEHGGEELDIATVYGAKWFVAFALVVSIVAFPAVYRKAFDADKPNWLQMIPIFTAGLGWQTIVDTVVGKEPEVIEVSASIIMFINGLVV